MNHHLTRMLCPCSELYALFEPLNKHQYQIYCITSSKSFNTWARGPFRLCFRLTGDKTVYVLAQKDLCPEFDALDYIKWANFENLGTGFFEIEWEYIMGVLKDRENLIVEVIFVPGNISDSSWDFFRYYWEHYFPSFSIKPDWQ
ncbi:E4.1 [Bovine adenovirus 7]|uniref:E4.1 protein n=1 Tax=Bovine adenovirus 7 TaxID=10511 RepID=A0A7R7IYC1_ADEB7|nr:E4.1 [Bovine adenovirus 7]BCS90533.1 E4.1 [Bovine adenovirus 7]